ncbi:hypothetical protein I5M27_08395 [Adhaeribacter sp. BT258]|uniref:Uncharacterized protein n=1 Tax=Adhaeribacter terrigena TaxID=2793070 RepID=A0ABS1C0Z7_9BACT|nr:hypothetical protein [Adhaeribacter terrigena]MBK0403005.1 hypothetical protein [Adhaeribacter terrigena]
MKAVNLVLNITSLVISLAAGDIYSSISAMLGTISAGLELSSKFRTFNLTPLDQHQGNHNTAKYMPSLISKG